MTVIKSPFEAQHGYKSPGFTVDNDGNVTVRTLTYTVTEETEVSGDFIMRQTGTGVWAKFTVDNYYVTGTNTLQENPGLAIERGSAYTFTLLLGSEDLSFNIKQDDSSNPGQYLAYNEGLKHTSEDGLTELTQGDAQGQKTGKVTFTVPANAPTPLYYADSDGTPIGVITVSDPTISGIGSFSSILTTGNLTAQGENATITLAPTGSSGTVVINPSNGGTLSNMDINALKLTTTDSVTMGGTNAKITMAPTGLGTVSISPETTGSLNNVTIGSTKAQNGTFLGLVSSSGTLNNTVIGNVTPTSGNFTVATMSANPKGPTQITNKKYVDMTSSALAIALGV